MYAFFWFVAAALKTDGKEAGTKQLASKLGEMWKAASSEDKARFEEEFKKDQVQFLEKQKAWQATPEFAEIESAEKLMGERRKLTESEQPDGQQAKGVQRGRSIHYHAFILTSLLMWWY